MKKTLLLTLLCAYHHYTFAQEIPGNSLATESYVGVASEEGPPPTTSDSETLTNIMNYLYNFGGYAGYDLKQTLSQPPINIMTSLTDFEKSLVETLFGAIPVNTISSASTILSTFIPTEAMSGVANYSTLNNLANTTYTSSNYSSASANNVSVVNLVDQLPAQQEPVSQAVLNLLTTPNDTVCDSPFTTGDKAPGACPYTTRLMVLNAALGSLPPTAAAAFSYGSSSGADDPTSGSVKNYLSQLNGNTLLAPLLYSTTSSNASQQAGLPASTQAQAAEDFIRIATGGINPPSLPNQDTYGRFLELAQPTTLNKGMANLTDGIGNLRPNATLATYLANLRIFAAQSSVPISNLYAMLSKRMPQGDSTAPKPSQALNEFEMATRRLYTPTTDAKGQPTQPWNDYLNASSPATVQKEMAMLLAEMNYQLYLNRQLQERILLTNSLLLIQALNRGQPSAEIGQAGGSE